MLLSVAGGGAVVAETGVWMGHATNNEAEYTGLVAGLLLARRCGVRRLLVQGGTVVHPLRCTAMHWAAMRCRCCVSGADAPARDASDSTLVTRQMTGEWKCEAPGLVPLLAAAQQAAAGFESVEFCYIPRAQNARVRAPAHVAPRVPMRARLLTLRAVSRRTRWRTRRWTRARRLTASMRRTRARASAVNAQCRERA